MQTNKTNPKINTIQDLRIDLLDAYESLKADPRRLNQVAELANTSGKIISTAKLELEYCAIRGERPEIPFLGKGGIAVKQIEGEKK